MPGSAVVGSRREAEINARAQAVRKTRPAESIWLAPPNAFGRTGLNLQRQQRLRLAALAGPAKPGWSCKERWLVLPERAQRQQRGTEPVCQSQRKVFCCVGRTARGPSRHTNRFGRACSCARRSLRNQFCGPSLSAQRQHRLIPHVLPEFARSIWQGQRKAFRRAGFRASRLGRSRLGWSCKTDLAGPASRPQPFRLSPRIRQLSLPTRADKAT